MNVKHHYNLESRANQDGSRLVFFNLSYGYTEHNPLTDKVKYIPMRISTKVRVEPHQWDFGANQLESKYADKNGSTKKNILDKVKKVSKVVLNNYYDNHDEIPTPSELKRLIQIKLDRKKKRVQSMTLNSVIDEIIADNDKLSITTKGKVRKDQIEKYRTVQSQLTDFGDYLGKELTLGNFDANMYFSFLDYRNNKRKENPKYPHGYLVNAISKNANTLTALLRKARKKKLKMSIDLDDSKLRVDEVKAVDSNVFLDEEMLELIFQTDTMKSQEFINARNYFVISSLTSLRYADMQHLHQVDVQQFSGKSREFEGVITEIRKTSKASRRLRTCIPILQPVKIILEENDGRFPKFPSNQVMNKQLKKFAAHIGLNDMCKVEKWYFKYEEPVIEMIPRFELVKCHIGRSSFVSNLTQLNVTSTIIENITHPTTPKSIAQSVYDKTSLVGKAELLLDAIDIAKTSSVYRL